MYSELRWLNWITPSRGLFLLECSKSDFSEDSFLFVQAHPFLPTCSNSIPLFLTSPIVLPNFRGYSSAMLSISCKFKSTHRATFRRPHLYKWTSSVILISNYLRLEAKPLNLPHSWEQGFRGQRHVSRLNCWSVLDPLNSIHRLTSRCLASSEQWRWQSRWRSRRGTTARRPSRPLMNLWQNTLVTFLAWK